MLRFLLSALGVIGKLALTLYFVLALIILGVRYWALPQVDTWRPQIEQQLSRALELDVSLGAVRGEWKGIRPQLQLDGVVLRDAGERPLLALNKVVAVLSWRSVLEGVPQFARIHAYGANLDVRRDEQGSIWVLGRSFDPGSKVPNDESPGRGAVAWLSRQPLISVHNATLSWTDAQRTGQPLVLQDVTLRLVGDAHNHAFSLAASPPESLGASLDIRGTFTPSATAHGTELTLDRGAGQLYAHVDQMRSRGWSPWMDLPEGLVSGRVSAQAWLDFEDGKATRFTSDVSVGRGRWRYGDRVELEAEQVRLFSAGPWEAFERLGPSPDAPIPGPESGTTGSSVDASIDYHLSAQNAQFTDDAIFASPLKLDALTAQGNVQGRSRSDFRASASQLFLRNADLEGSLHGSWENGTDGSLGRINIEGNFDRALVSAVGRYLPEFVDADVKAWIAKGLVEGELSDARMILKGDLAKFPFNDDPSSGQFSVEGRYAGAVIDYLPPEKGQLGWPRLEAMRGHLSINGAALNIVADEGRMALGPNHIIQLKGVQAQIPDLAEEAVLSIAGETSADGSAYLALMKQSPLGELLGHVLDEATTDGLWRVPLALTIPLTRAEETSVKGNILFAGSRLILMPGTPGFTGLTGKLDFTDDSIGADRLKAEFLGGAVSLSGAAGPGKSGLVAQGHISAAALDEYLGLQGLKRLSGGFPYRAVIKREPSTAVTVHAQSNLKGLSIRLPAPLGKESSAAANLGISWRHSPDRGAASLELALGEDISLRLMGAHPESDRPFFHAAALGVGRKPELPSSGMVVDIDYPAVDVDEWRAIANEFAQDSAQAGARHPKAWLPSLKELRLEARHARFHDLPFDKFAFTARKSDEEEWRMDVTSSQTAGTLFWRASKGGVAGQIDAKFDRLALGADPSGFSPEEAPVAEEEPFADELDIPAINLTVNKLRLYGREVGALSVVGVNQARGRLWKLSELVLNSPSAVLTGSGLWRLHGSKRGLVLDAEARIKNLGAYLDQVGYADVIKGGAGTIRAQLEWRNMPWSFNKADLNGSVEFAVDKGRFVTVNSYSARLLELLSMQSLKRLAKMEFNPSGLAKEGFPFDSLRGTLALNQGIVNTRSYRVVGPAGTIVLEGDVNLVNNALDLHAVVIPNLDVSGAAIAAGIALNPIVGVGAFLAQWLLQAPLAKAMTVEYRITGNWDDVKIREIPVVHDEKRTRAPAVSP